MALRRARPATTALYLEALGCARSPPRSTASARPAARRRWSRRRGSTRWSGCRRSPRPCRGSAACRPPRRRRVGGRRATWCSASTSARPAPRRWRSTLRPARAALGGLPADRRRPGRRRPGAAAPVPRRPGRRCHRVRGFGVTGSGREIVGSLLTTCYGSEAVYVLNEIAAHAAGRAPLRPAGRHHLRDRRAGRQVHPARRGPGGRRRHERGLQRRHRLLHRGAGQAGSPASRRGAARARRRSARRSGVSLGQHCSVFMAEIIDEAVAARRRPRGRSSPASTTRSSRTT